MSTLPSKLPSTEQIVQKKTALRKLFTANNYPPEDFTYSTDDLRTYDPL